MSACSGRRNNQIEFQKKGHRIHISAPVAAISEKRILLVAPLFNDLIMLAALPVGQKCSRNFFLYLSQIPDRTGSTPVYTCSSN